jgi:hypothetical protein
MKRIQKSDAGPCRTNSSSPRLTRRQQGQVASSASQRHQLKDYYTKECPGAVGGASGVSKWLGRARAKRRRSLAGREGRSRAETRGSSASGIEGRELGSRERGRREVFIDDIKSSGSDKRGAIPETDAPYQKRQRTRNEFTSLYL